MFRLGRLALQLGHDADAQALLQRALDLDALRFRTDSTLNQVIRDVAASAPDATLVDLARDLSAISSHGCAGDDLVYEHVHLTFNGTYEAAKRLLPHVITDLKRRGLTQGDPAHVLTLEEARQRLAFTAYEQLLICVELLKRFRAPPFTGQIDDGYRIATWQRRADAANALLQRPETTDALLNLYQAALKASPDDWVLARNAGAMLVARQRPGDAIPLLERAVKTIPDDADTLIALGLAYRGAGRAAEAEKIFAKVRAIEPRHPLLPAK